MRTILTNQTSKRDYLVLADYAAQQGAPEEAFIKAGYQLTTHTNRSALQYPTKTGNRCRYLDGQEPRHSSPYGYKPCWYGLETAVEMAAALNKPLVMVNGASGVIAAQYHDIPAFAVSDGETRVIPQNMLEELTTTWQGEILIASDCDEAGQKSASKRARLLIDVGYIVHAVDLQLGENGDIADFCKIHQAESLDSLFTLPEIAPAMPKMAYKPREIGSSFTHNDDHAKRVAAQWLDSALAELARANTDRRNILLKVATKIGGLVKGGYVSAAEAEYGLMNACHSCRLIDKYGEREILRMISGSFDHADATVVQVRDNPRHASKQAESNSNQDTRQKVQYISDDLPPGEIAKHRTLLIQGGTGLGKSRAVGDYANTLSADSKLTCMAQFRLLVRGLSQYFADADHYLDADSAHQPMLGAVKRLLTSVSSLPKFDRTGSDLLVIDELAGVLKFVVSSSTFKDNEALLAYQALKRTISSARQMVGMDANLSPIEMDWINNLRGNDATFKTYQRTDNRGTVTLLKDKDAAIWTIKKLLMHHQGQIYVACSSEKTATATYDLFSEGEYRVFKITRDTSNTPEVTRFIQNADYRSQFDLIIYDPAVGSGVDWSEPVYALIGIFDRMPLAPEEAFQLFGRIRHAKRYYAAVPSYSDGYETLTAEEIKASYLANEAWTAQHTGQPANTSGDYLEMLNLWSLYQERHQFETASWRGYFAERLKQNGFQVQWHNVGISKGLRAAFKAWRDDRKIDDWNFTRQACGTALDDEAIEKARAGGLEITAEMRLRNTRYKIEDVLGCDQVNERDADLMVPRKRLALYRGIQRKNGRTLDLDTLESNNGVLLQKRRYSYARLKNTSHLLSLIGFEGKPFQQDVALLKYFLQKRSAPELNQTFAIITTFEATRLAKAIGHQTENGNTVTGRLKWFVEHLWGIKPHAKQKGRGDSRYMVYSFREDEVDYLIDRRDQAAERRKSKT